MMKHSRILIALGFWAGCALTSHAQVPGAPRPAVSPYLNLNRAGESVALNYYGLVRPQLAANRAFQALGTEINNLDAANQANQANQTVQTGHTSSFMTQGRYFMTNGASGAKQGTQAGAHTPPPARGR
jgi:hypothetical protein